MQVKIVKQEGYSPWILVECKDTAYKLETIDSWISQLRVARNWLKNELEKTHVTKDSPAQDSSK